MALTPQAASQLSPSPYSQRDSPASRKPVRGHHRVKHRRGRGGHLASSQVARFDSQVLGPGVCSSAPTATPNRICSGGYPSGARLRLDAGSRCYWWASQAAPQADAWRECEWEIRVAGGCGRCQNCVFLTFGTRLVAFVVQPMGRQIRAKTSGEGKGKARHASSPGSVPASNGLAAMERAPWS